jgi:hypothetical protein
MMRLCGRKFLATVTQLIGPSMTYAVGKSLLAYVECWTVRSKAAHRASYRVTHRYLYFLNPNAIHATSSTAQQEQAVY